MIKLDNSQALREAQVKAGDVLMVAMELEDKHKKGRTFTWRFFAMVTKASKSQRLVEVLVLDEKEREPMRIDLLRENITAHLLPEDKWPDGVYAFRTKAILDDRVDVDLF